MNLSYWKFEKDPFRKLALFPQSLSGTEILVKNLSGKNLGCLTDYCLIMAGILFPMTGCSHGPRDEYARDLTAALNKVYANLEQYRKNALNSFINGN